MSAVSVEQKELISLSSTNAPCVPQFPPKGYNILAYHKETRKINTLVNVKHLDPATKNAQKNRQNSDGRVDMYVLDCFSLWGRKKKI